MRALRKRDFEFPHCACERFVLILRPFGWDRGLGGDPSADGSQCLDAQLILHELAVRDQRYRGRPVRRQWPATHLPCLSSGLYRRRGARLLAIEEPAAGLWRLLLLPRISSSLLLHARYFRPVVSRCEN